MNREGPSEHLDDGAVKVVFSEHGGVDGGRHEDDVDPWVGLDHVPQDHHQEVRLHGHTAEMPHKMIQNEPQVTMTMNKY